MRPLFSFSFFSLFFSRHSSFLFSFCSRFFFSPSYNAIFRHAHRTLTSQLIPWIIQLVLAANMLCCVLKTTLEGYVGFDTITQQIEKKLLKRGFHFNVMVVGEQLLLPIYLFERTSHPPASPAYATPPPCVSPRLRSIWAWKVDSSEYHICLASDWKQGSPRCGWTSSTNNRDWNRVSSWVNKSDDLHTLLNY